LFNTLALVPPAAGSTKGTLPNAPQWCKVKGNRDSVILAWNVCEVLTGEEMPYYFGIYRFNGDRVGEFTDAKNLLAITQPGLEDTKWYFGDQNLNIGEYYTYCIIGYNRFNVASYASEPVMIKKTKNGVKRKRRWVGYLFR
jgi:hypothetical protein